MTAWTQSLALYQEPLSEHAQIPKCHIFVLFTWEAVLSPFKEQISMPESLVKRKNACYFFQLCTFSKNPVLFELDNPECTVHKCSVTLQTKGTKEMSIWNHQKLKKYVGNILLPSTAALCSKSNTIWSLSNKDCIAVQRALILLLSLLPPELRDTYIASRNHLKLLHNSMPLWVQIKEWRSFFNSSK